MINDEIEITQIISEIQKDEILLVMYDAFEKKLGSVRQRGVLSATHSIRMIRR